MPCTSMLILKCDESQISKRKVKTLKTKGVNALGSKEPRYLTLNMHYQFFALSRTCKKEKSK